LVTGGAAGTGVADWAGTGAGAAGDDGCTRAVLPQAASMTAARQAQIDARRRSGMDLDLVQWVSRRGESIAPDPVQRDSSMWIFYLEAGVALALLIFIVWWTMPTKDKAALPQIEDKPEPKAGEPRDE
jgi:hypothetical protein